MTRQGLKKTSVIALCGIITAISIVIMIIANFIPFLTYGIPAVAGALTVIIVLDIGKKYAWLVYVCVSLLSLILCANEPEHVFTYIMFFGFYPIIKSYLEHIPSRQLCFAVKIILFTVCFGATYLFTTFVLGIDSDSFGELGKWGLAVFFVSAEVMFIAYDIALTSIIALYNRKYRARLRKFLK